MIKAGLLPGREGARVSCSGQEGRTVLSLSDYNSFRDGHQCRVDKKTGVVERVKSLIFTNTEICYADNRFVNKK